MVRRQLSAATERSFAFISYCTNFSASAKVAEDTSGPTSGAVPNAGGAPGVGCEGFEVWLCTAAAPKRPKEASVMNCLRDLTDGSPRDELYHFCGRLKKCLESSCVSESIL